jgi:hypothetical protein
MDLRHNIPKASIALAGGPMNAMPTFLSISGSFGFSDAWPQPAQTACSMRPMARVKTNSGRTRLALLFLSYLALLQKQHALLEPLEPCEVRAP